MAFASFDPGGILASAIAMACKIAWAIWLPCAIAPRFWDGPVAGEEPIGGEPCPGAPAEGGEEPPAPGGGAIEPDMAMASGVTGGSCGCGESGSWRSPLGLVLPRRSSLPPPCQDRHRPRRMVAGAAPPCGTAPRQRNLLKTTKLHGKGRSDTKANPGHANRTGIPACKIGRRIGGPNATLALRRPCHARCGTTVL